MNSMFERNLLIPVLVIVVIGAPIVYHEMEGKNSDLESSRIANQPASIDGQFPHASYGLESSIPLAPNGLPSRNASRATVVPVESPFQLAGFPKQSGGTPFERTINHSNPADGNREIVPIQSAAQPERLSAPPIILPNSIAHTKQAQSSQSTQTPHIVAPNPIATPNPIQGPVAIVPGSANTAFDPNIMTPDYAAAETYIFPGNEFGPDLAAEPLEHLPVQNFGEIFRFDLSKTWVQNRWKRISTNPIDYSRDLTGMRVPLVTGTNTWDLHGSLTYFFDRQQKLQRITFRGWTGNPERLLQLLKSQFNFKPQPTNLAGFYLSESWRRTIGGLLMKTPAVIDSKNPYEQYGLVLEINNPQGNFELSEDFHRLILGADPQ